jgi:hypothetical protein
MNRVLLAGLLFSILGVLFTAVPYSQAQGVGYSGEVTGTVTDPTGAVLPRVSISVVNTQTGLRREAITNAAGRFDVPGLQPGTYDVTAKISGFGTAIRKGVEVAIGATVDCDFSLQVKAQTVIEVTGQAPVVETSKGSVADTINLQSITNLPIDRRDYLTFTLLAPGVSDSTRVADDQDFRVKQTPQSGLSFYGSNGRGNSITVDGGETSGDSGGVRPTVSQEAVQEFQINRSNFGAQLGAATGASINIVTKSGSNTVHGSLFSFFRNDAMDAADPFSFSQALKAGETFNPAGPDLQGTNIKDTLTRQQFGGSLGFPIRKDKTFAFIAFEGLRQDAQNAVPLLTDTNIYRSSAQQNSIFTGLVAEGSAPVPCLNNPNGTVTFLPANVCAGALQSALTTSQLTGLTAGQTAINSFLISQFEGQGGLFPFVTREYLASGRLDHHLTENDQVSITYRYADDSEQSPDLHSLTAFSAGSESKTQDHNVQGAWYHQFKTTAQNELRFQWNHENFNVLPNAPAEIGLQIPGFINNLGSNIFLPSLTTLRRSEYADNFTFMHGTHTFQFGGSELLRGNDTASHTFLPGRFVFGPLPGILVSPCMGVDPNTHVNDCFGNQTSATINSLQAASLGLPQIYQQGFGNPRYPYFSRPLTGLYFRDRWNITPTFTLNYGLRYELDSQFLPLTTYTNDFAPRVSFAWDPFQTHKTVIRGGYGIFFSPIDVQIPDVDLSLGVVNQNRSAVANGSTGSQVGNLLGTCGMAIAGGTTIIPGSGGSPCNREISIYVDPITPTGIPGLQTAPAVFQTLFGEGLIQCTTPTAGNQACVTPASVSPLGIRNANSGALSPLQVVFTNQPNYRPPIAQQVSVEIEREFSTGLSVSVGGVYVHTQRLPVAIDTNLTQAPLLAPMTTLTLANGQKVTYRNWNTSPAADPVAALGIPGYTEPCATTPPAPSPCFVSQLVTQSNQYSSVAGAVYEGLIVEVKKRLGNNFSLFGNYTYSKAYDNSTDYNTDYGPQDPTNLNLDRSLSEFDERHKVVFSAIADSPWKSPFLSGFELAPIFAYHSGHPFNLLAGGEVNGNNHITNERPIGAPRDSGLGPDYTDFDMRLSWKHKIAEKGQLEFTAEGFNIANHTNYASVNNEVSPLFGFLPANGVPFTTFNVRGVRPGTVLPDGTRATASTPLAFTSALPKREVQLGVRFSF